MSCHSIARPVKSTPASAQVVNSPDRGAAARARSAASCTVTVTPTPMVTEQGAAEGLDFASDPNTPIDALILPSAPYPTQVGLFNTGPFTPAQVLQGNAVANGYHYTFTTGFDGHALLSVPVPRTAPTGPVQVQATATCTGGIQASAQTTFSVQVAQLVPFSGHLLLASHHLILRSPKLPPVAGSTVHETVTVLTNPNDLVTVVATIASTNSANLGTPADGGTAHQSGDLLTLMEGSADSGGQAIFSVPFSADLLTPGRGAVIRLVVSSASQSAEVAYRTSMPIREEALHLVVQVKGSTRGGLRPMLAVGHPANGVSTLSVLVLADSGSHLTGQAVFGTRTVTAAALAGPGGRATLKFAVPNSVAPFRGSHGLGSVTVSSAFRGATIGRSIQVSFGRQ